MSNKPSSTLKNVFGIVISNCTSLLSGVLLGFVVPLMMSVNDFGLYKTFTLYMAYGGFFGFGLIDGIFLDYGGKNFGQLNRLQFRSFFKWYLLLHSLVFIIMAVVLCFTENTFLFIALAVNIIACNTSNYYQQISQITQRFKEYSYRKILQSIINIVSILILYYYYTKGETISYQLLIIILVLTNIALAFWYIYTYRELTFGVSLSLYQVRNEIGHLIKLGFPLLFANLCSALILTVDRQFVNWFFDTSTYAVYAFAYNLLTLVTVATSAISVVLYPILKRSETKKMIDKYEVLMQLLLLFIFGALVIYFPLVEIVKEFLPKYNNSLLIFRIIFPGLAVSSAITVVIHNYFKALGINSLFFKKSVAILICNIIVNVAICFAFHSTTIISISSIIVMLAWYVYVESTLREKFRISGGKSLYYILFMIIAFYVSTQFKSIWLGGIVYILFYCVITYLCTKQNLSEIKAIVLPSSKKI